MIKNPVVLIGSITKLEQIEIILEDSKIEYIGKTRALMKDPYLIKKQGA